MRHGVDEVGPARRGQAQDVPAGPPEQLLDDQDAENVLVGRDGGEERPKAERLGVGIGSIGFAQFAQQLLQLSERDRHVGERTFVAFPEFAEKTGRRREKLEEQDLDRLARAERGGDMSGGVSHVTRQDDLAEGRDVGRDTGRDRGLDVPRLRVP